MLFQTEIQQLFQYCSWSQHIPYRLSSVCCYFLKPLPCLFAFHGYLFIRNLADEFFSYKCVNWVCFNVSENNFSENSGFCPSTFPPLYQAAHHVLVSQFSTKIPQKSCTILLFPAFLLLFLGSRRYCIYHTLLQGFFSVQTLFLGAGPEKISLWQLYMLLLLILFSQKYCTALRISLLFTPPDRVKIHLVGSILWNWPFSPVLN